MLINKIEALSFPIHFYLEPFMTFFMENFALTTIIGI